LKKKKGRTEKYKKALKVETWSDTECEESDEEYANICLIANLESDSDFETDSNSDSNKEVEGSNFKVPVNVSKYIDKLCLSVKTMKSLLFLSEIQPVGCQRGRVDVGLI